MALLQEAHARRTLVRAILRVSPDGRSCATGPPCASATPAACRSTAAATWPVPDASVAEDLQLGAEARAGRVRPVMTQVVVDRSAVGYHLGPELGVDPGRRATATVAVPVAPGRCPPGIEVVEIAEQVPDHRMDRAEPAGENHAGWGWGSGWLVRPPRGRCSTSHLMSLSNSGHGWCKQPFASGRRRQASSFPGSPASATTHQTARRHMFAGCGHHLHAYRRHGERGVPQLFGPCGR